MTTVVGSLRTTLVTAAAHYHDHIAMSTVQSLVLCLCSRIGGAPWQTGIVAMVAQGLIRCKTIQQFTPHDIPSVHGSGAIGLKTVQSKTSRFSEAWTANSEPLSTLLVSSPPQPWRCSRETTRQRQQQCRHRHSRRRRRPVQCQEGDKPRQDLPPMRNAQWTVHRSKWLQERHA